jgi:hypothetical protein
MYSNTLNYLFILKPFDTIKTKMQAQKGFENLSMMKSFITVFKKDGIRGLYRYKYLSTDVYYSI